MNKRIKELAQQAVEDTQLMMIMEYTNFESKLYEKFAELIVKECVAICQDTDGEDNIDAKSGRQDCAVEIKDHFGVN